MDTKDNIDDWVAFLRASTATVLGTKPKRRKRKPRLATVINDAAKAGHAVTGATVRPDGAVSVEFGTTSTTADEMSGNGASTNPWDEVLSNAADQKRPS